MTDDNIDEERLRSLQERIAKLPREMVPPQGAWRAIHAAIEVPAGQDMIEGAAGIIPMVRRPFALRHVFLAAAALILVASSSAVTAIVLNRGAVSVSANANANANAQRSAIAIPAPDAAFRALAEFTAVENGYIATVSRLSAALESGESQLAPETLAKLRESLRVIDAAILEARQALAADPANSQLIEMLSTSYSQKVDLLRRTTEMGRS